MANVWNSECQKCSDPCAYTGFLTQECANRDCENFSEKQFQAVEEEFENLAQIQKEYELHQEYNHDGDDSYDGHDTEPPGPPDPDPADYIWGTPFGYGSPVSTSQSNTANKVTKIDPSDPSYPPTQQEQEEAPDNSLD